MLLLKDLVSVLLFHEQRLILLNTVVELLQEIINRA